MKNKKILKKLLIAAEELDKIHIAVENASNTIDSLIFKVADQKRND